MRKVNLITVLTFGVFIACNTSKTENHVSNNNETKVKEININSKFQIFTTAKDTNLRLTKTKAGVFGKKVQTLETELAVFVNPKKTFQEFLGIGGAITDASSEVALFQRINFH